MSRVLGSRLSRLESPLAALSQLRRSTLEAGGGSADGDGRDAGEGERQRH